VMKSSIAKMLVFWGSIICLSPPACNKWGQRDLSMQQVGQRETKYATSGPKDHINTLGGGPSKVSFFCRHRDLHVTLSLSLLRLYSVASWPLSPFFRFICLIYWNGFLFGVADQVSVVFLFFSFFFGDQLCRF